jgi:hypothetical protein
MSGEPIGLLDVTIRRQRRSAVVRAIWIASRRGPAAVRHMLGGMMKAKRRTRTGAPSLLDVVALLTDIPAQSLVRGHCR